jgi:hypothetical protein
VTQLRQPRTKPRRELLAEIRARFIATGYPRLLVLFILLLSGLAAFAFSAGTLRLGFEPMGPRYLLATLVGYAAFLLLIRIWIAFHRREWDPDFDIPDLSSGPSGPDRAAFSGGESGGAGARASWGAPDDHVGFEIDVPDADDAWPLVIAAIVVLGSGLAMFYVVYAAPVLLAEIALDAALVTGIYRKLRKQDARYWLASALRRTWMPAAIVAICVSLAGVGLQWAVPSARSIGEAVYVLSR